MNGTYVGLTPKQCKTMGDIDQVAVDMRVTQMLRARRNEILHAIGDRIVEPTAELLSELAELDEALAVDPLEYPMKLLREELKEEEKDLYRSRIRAEIAAETDDISRQCLEHSLALIDDPASPWNQD
jgi:hypothetical protein